MSGSLCLRTTLGFCKVQCWMHFLRNLMEAIFVPRGLGVPHVLPFSKHGFRGPILFRKLWAGPRITRGCPIQSRTLRLRGSGRSYLNRLLSSSKRLTPPHETIEDLLCLSDASHSTHRSQRTELLPALPRIHPHGEVCLMECTLGLRHGVKGVVAVR